MDNDVETIIENCVIAVEDEITDLSTSEKIEAIDGLIDDLNQMILNLERRNA